MDKAMPPETAAQIIDLANIAAWLELQEQRIARLETELGAVHAVVALLKRVADPHRRAERP